MDKVKAVAAKLKLDVLAEKIKNNSIAKAVLAWVVIILFLAFIVDNLIMPAFAGAFSSTETVPNLEGLSKEAAESALEEAGFKVEWTEEGRYSALVPAGMVLVQMPKAGRVAKVGRTVKLTQSLGLREVEIPNLRGKSQKQATISLTRAGLVQGEIVLGAHQSIPRGVVIRTIPEGGEMVRLGDTVKVVISAGVTKGKVLLPNFEGVLLDDVFPKLEALGFRVGKITRAEDPENRGYAPGTVLETKPKYGDYLSPKTKINFVVVD